MNIFLIIQKYNQKCVANMPCRLRLDIGNNYMVHMDVTSILPILGDEISNMAWSGRAL